MRKKFAGQKFSNLFQLTSQAVNYETILRKEEQKKPMKKTYCTDFNYNILAVEAESEKFDEHLDVEIDITEILIKKPYTCRALSGPATTALRTSSR